LPREEILFVQPWINPRDGFEGGVKFTNSRFVIRGVAEEGGVFAWERMNYEG